MSEQLLTCHAAGAVWAIAVEEVEEILHHYSLTRLPLLPPGFAGVVNVRGHAVPVADLAVLAGGTASNAERPMIVLRANTSAVAMLIDSVDDVVDARTFVGGAVIDAQRVLRGAPC